MCNRNMNQHEWVQACQARYEEQGLTPEPGGEWQEAHYPTPKCEGGTRTIWLLRSDHQVQGLLQSEEYKCQCFFSGEAKSFLKEGPFVLAWFELWDLYDKWSSHHGREVGKKQPLEVRKRNGRSTGPKNVESMLMDCRESGRKGGKNCGGKNGKKSSKPVVCVDTGAVFPSACEASRQTGVEQASISRSCRKGCRAGGFHWNFLGRD
jgi:hypothetical protein